MPAECGCPQLNPAEWNLTKHSWPKRSFFRTSHRLLFHMPIGIAGAIRRGMEGIQSKHYSFRSPYMMLDDETGAFTADMLLAIEELPTDDPNVTTWEPAILYSRYYHGPFRGLKRELRMLLRHVQAMEHRAPAKIYTWVTNCPKCWKENGGPTTILFARMDR